MSEVAGRCQARPLSLPGPPSPSAFCMLSDLIPTPCDANITYPEETAVLRARSLPLDPH